MLVETDELPRLSQPISMQLPAHGCNDGRTQSKRRLQIANESHGVVEKIADQSHVLELIVANLFDRCAVEREDSSTGKRQQDRRVGDDDELRAHLRGTQQKVQEAQLPG